MAPHSGKVCVKKILKLDVTIASLAVCRIQTSQRGGPLWTPACRTEMVKIVNDVFTKCTQLVNSDVLHVENNKNNLIETTRIHQVIKRIIAISRLQNTICN